MLHSSAVWPLLSFALLAQAQLIQQGDPIPRRDSPPVVFLNGFEINCAGSSFQNTFVNADQVMQAAGRVSLFFNYCAASNGNSSIEDLGDAFGTFLAGLKYTDGQPVTQVDAVAYSMGGLILRSYLSGKRANGFNPPQSVPIRKAVFLATPHFGTGIPLGLPFASSVLSEISSGSQFLFDLATWNQGADDFHGVDAIAAIGNGGTGRATTKGFDDGVVALTSGSLGFYGPNRTRVLSYCHTDGGGLTSLAGLCDSSAHGISKIDSATHPVARLIVSFFNGTSEWQSIGTAAEQDPLLSISGGIIATMRDSNDTKIAPDGVTAASANQSKSLNIAQLAYTDMFNAQLLTLTGVSGGTRASSQFTLPATVYRTSILKPGPSISGVASGAAALFPLGVASGEIISIYGSGFDNAQVTINGSTLQLYASTPTLINAVLPDLPAGYTALTIQNAAGKSSVNLFVVPATPAIFTLDQTGKGPAAAVDASAGFIVDSTHPLKAGDYVALFLTGLGATHRTNGLDVANVLPTVTIAGKNCPVTYAGRVPGITGLDQINCIVPAVGPQSAAAVVVSSLDRASNQATVSIQ